MWTELRTTEWSKVRSGGGSPGRTCSRYRGSISTSAAIRRLNDRARVTIKSYVNVERAMCEARFKWNTQTSHQLPISKKRYFILGYKQENHASPSCEEEKDEDEKEEEVEEKDYDEDDDVDEGWPADEDIDKRWRVNAADYFKETRIRNVVAEDGTVIDWEGESNRGIIQEISCMEWERTVFHYSPLIVLLFERYARASTNWKVLKELENAVKVYRKYKKLPPRTVKVDVKIEIDLASALRAKDIPQLLFIKGDKLLYRETEIRTADELVKMIAHFYYNAKRPSFLEAEVV